jgi:putative addiction module component (TIGR02574 family)
VTATFKELEEQAQDLAAEDRARLAETLLKSLQTPVGEIQAARAEEIEERVAAFDAGESKAYAAEDVFAEARRVNRRPSL